MSSQRRDMALAPLPRKKAYAAVRAKAGDIGGTRLLRQARKAFSRKRNPIAPPPSKSAAPLAAALAIALIPAAPRAQTDEGGLAMSLGYDGRLVLKVLEVEVQERATVHGFSASSRLTSTGILAAFKHIDERAATQGRITGGAPEPGVFDYQNLGGKTHRKVHAVWTGDDVATTADPPFPNLGDPPASRGQRRAATDPLTALMAMTLNANRGTVCRRSYVFFDGKQLYALDFSNPRGAPASTTETGLGLVDHFRCDVRFREVAGFRKKPPAQQNQGLQRPINVDFAQAGAGGPWVISSLRAQTPLGWAVIELKRMTVTGKAPAP